MEHADLTPHSNYGVVRPKPVTRVTHLSETPDETGIKRIFADSVAHFESKKPSSVWHWRWKKAKRIQRQPGWVPSIPPPFTCNYEIRTCKQCGDEFPVVNSVTYCSEKCEYAWRLERQREKQQANLARRPIRPCEQCGKPFQPTRITQRYCRVRCRCNKNADRQRQQRKAG